MNAKRIITGISALAMLVCVPNVAKAQYLDDDIYYTPSKTTKTKKTTTKTETYVSTPDYPAADTYATTGHTYYLSDSRDVDEYNRRGIFATGDNYTDTSVAVDSVGEFQYTQRIERYHNPEVVNQTNDNDLIDYYYNEANTQPTVINVYVDAYDLLWDAPYYGFCNPYRHYSRRYWDPLWSWTWYSLTGWDPYWSWTWSNSWWPAWSWSWGWGHNWAWNAGWNHGWHHGWNHGPAWNHRPNHGSGMAWRPSSHGAHKGHHAVGNGSSMSKNRSASYGSRDSYSRPGNMGRGRYGNSTGSSSFPSRRSAISSNTKNNNHGSYGSSSSTRGRSKYGSSDKQSDKKSSSSDRSVKQRQSSKNNDSSSSSSSWSRGSSNSSRSSSVGSGSSFGGGRSSGGHSGGSRGGGGGGRGRR